MMGSTRMLMVAGVFTIMLFCAGLTDGKPLEVTVDDDWAGADYDNIQEAVNNTTAGNWIYVHEGVYEENVVVNKTMRLIGNGTNETIVNGGLTGSAIAVRADDVEIERFGLTGHAWTYGILDIRNSTNAHVHNCSMNRTYGSDSYGINLVNVNWSDFEDLYIYRTHNLNLDSTDNLTFRNCTIRGNAESGIYMYNVTTTHYIDCTVNQTMSVGIMGGSIYWNVYQNCTFARNHMEGISAWDTENNTFVDCLIYDNGKKYDPYDGAYLDFWFNNTFENCSFYDNGKNGIYFWYSDSNLFLNTTVYDNAIDGIYVYLCENNTFIGCNIYNNTYNGTTFDTCNWTDVHNSSFHHNPLYGVGLENSENNTITYNEFINNTEYGVYVGWDCWNNVIHHNNFLKNHNSPQAADETGNNQWTDGSEGNWWDNWNGTGAYPLDGAANATDDAPADDPYPTSAPEKVPELTLMMSVAAMLVVAVAVRRRGY